MVRRSRLLLLVSASLVAVAGVTTFAVRQVHGADRPRTVSLPPTVTTPTPTPTAPAPSTPHPTPSWTVVPLPNYTDGSVSPPGPAVR